MKRMEIIRIAVALSFLAGPAAAGEVPCGERTLERVNGEIKAALERNRKAATVDSAVSMAEMIQAVVKEYLEPTPLGKGMRVKTTGHVLADLTETGYPSEESDAVLRQFPFLKMESGSGGWGLAANLDPSTSVKQFQALQSGLYSMVELAIFGSTETNKEAEAIGRWACDTDVQRTPNSPYSGIFTPEQCHRLFS